MYIWPFAKFQLTDLHQWCPLGLLSKDEWDFRGYKGISFDCYFSSWNQKRNADSSNDINSFETVTVSFWAWQLRRPARRIRGQQWPDNLWAYLLGFGLHHYPSPGLVSQDSKVGMPGAPTNSTVGTTIPWVSLTRRIDWFASVFY